MTNETPDSFTKHKKRALLPWWIKVFIWIFLLFGVVAPIGLIVGLAGFTYPIALYGVETNDPLSLVGIGLMLIFLIKGVTAYGLWTEKNWALDLGQIDAILGIVICILVMIGLQLPGGHRFSSSFRLEIFLLIPFLLKLRDLKRVW